MSIVSTGEIRDEAARRGYDDLVEWIDARINERVKARNEVAVGDKTVSAGHHYDISIRQPYYRRAENGRTTRGQLIYETEEGARYTRLWLRDWVFMGRAGYNMGYLLFRKDNGSEHWGGRHREVNLRDIESLSETTCTPDQ